MHGLIQGLVGERVVLRIISDYLLQGIGKAIGVEERLATCLPGESLHRNLLCTSLLILFLHGVWVESTCVILRIREQALS